MKSASVSAAAGGSAAGGGVSAERTLAVAGARVAVLGETREDEGFEVCGKRLPQPLQ